MTGFYLTYEVLGIALVVFAAALAFVVLGIPRLRTGEPLNAYHFLARIGKERNGQVVQVDVTSAFVTARSEKEAREALTQRLYKELAGTGKFLEEPPTLVRAHPAENGLILGFA